MRELTPLCKLARECETDKGGRHLRYGGGDSDTCHEYTEAYYNLFSERRDAVTAVLEVGIGHEGSSLRMWERFFPKAYIYGLDSDQQNINRAMRPNWTEGRVACLAADQGDAASLLRAMLRWDQTFDLIIDDGSHVFEHQVLTANVLMPFLKPNGYYVIEDIHDDCHPEKIGNLLPAIYSWYGVSCGYGIGKAHCHCGCNPPGPEQLLIVRHKRGVLYD